MLGVGNQRYIGPVTALKELEVHGRYTQINRVGPRNDRNQSSQSKEGTRSVQREEGFMLAVGDQDMQNLGVFQR